MTENETKIMEAREILIDLSKDNKRIYAEEYKALEKAIFALEEIRQYRAIGTIEEFKSLKEKSLAKKVKGISLTHEGRAGEGACGMMKCSVCKTEFEPLNENRYTVKDTNILTHEESHWDCFDCPKCGCQVIGYKRLKKVGAE